MTNHNFLKPKRKPDFILILLIIAFILIVLAFIYFNTGSRVSVTGNIVAEGLKSGAEKNLTVQEPEREIKKHVPLNLSEDDILVSFRIDDITFETKQKPVLENALYLARKYNITFDLAVIADRFDRKMDKEVFKIYEDNQDVFEVVAHGLTHANPINFSSKGEFLGELRQPIPKDIQEEHIRKMRDIFEKHNLAWGTKIFLLPWSAGDENTIKIAEKYGYKLMTQSDVPDKSYEYDDGNIIVSRAWVSIAMNETLSNEEIEKYINRTNNLISKNQKNIQIVMHPVNFRKIENSEELIKRFSELSKENLKIKFGMISERFGR